MNFWMNQQFEPDLPKRVTGASMVFGVVLFLFLLRWRLDTWAFSYLLGAGLGIYSFDVFRMGVRTFMRAPGMEEEAVPRWKKIVIGGLFVLKLPIWLVTIYAAAVDPTLPLFAFVGGIATPQFVVVSKVVSRTFVGKPGGEGGDKDSTDMLYEQNTRSVTQ